MVLFLSEIKVDPEALKTLSMQMTLEQKVRLTFHAWAVEPIVKDGAMRDAVHVALVMERALAS